MAKEVGTSALIDTWASGGDIVEPSGAKIANGWDLLEQPPHEYENWLQNLHGQKINHILQNGIPLWNTATEYLENNIVLHEGSVYRAKQDNDASEPPNINWQKIAPFPVKNSLEIDDADNEIQLVGDEDAPGANKYYGTDAAGEKGYHASITNGFETGDFKISYGTAAKTGYVRCNGRSIGNAASAATERANADTEALFIHLWNTDSNLTVSGGRGASAAADYAANKNITLPDARNNTLAFIDGMGNSNTNRLTTAVNGKLLGAIGGAQTHTLSVGEMPPHTHGYTKKSVTGGDNSGGDPESSTNVTAQTGSTGGGAAHNNTQPTIIIGTLYIKL